MASQQKFVATTEEMLVASRDTAVQRIVVRSVLPNLPSFRLSPGQKLVGEGDQAILSFAPGSDGLQLSSDNEVTDIRLETSVDKRAIFNDTSVASLGRMRLADIAAIGQVQILARDQVRSGHVEVDGLDIIAADARAQSDRPHGFGVYVIQGAFTLWNMQADEKVVVSADLKGLSVGRPVAPVLGSGIFVSGAGFEGAGLLFHCLKRAPSTAMAKSLQALPM